MGHGSGRNECIVHWSSDFTAGGFGSYFKKQQLDVYLAKQNLWFRWGVLLVLIAAVAIFGIYGPGYDAQQFIYFQF